MSSQTEEPQEGSNPSQSYVYPAPALAARRFGAIKMPLSVRPAYRFSWTHVVIAAFFCIETRAITPIAPLCGSACGSPNTPARGSQFCECLHATGICGDESVVAESYDTARIASRAA